MKQIPVIFWTGTGNTQMMADAVAEAINAAGAEAVVKNVSEITADEAAGYDALALGCPAMGAEVLEECEFEPFFTELEGKLAGKKVALFGSAGAEAICRIGKHALRTRVRHLWLTAYWRWVLPMTKPWLSWRKQASCLPNKA